jgi:hypothetical protein
VKRFLLIALLVACKETDTVHLTFGLGAANSTTAGSTPVAFRCRDASGKFLPARGVSGRMFHAALLIDFIELDGVPSCRPTDIARWCASPEHACKVITDDPNAVRVCFEETKTLGVGDDAVKAMGEVLTDFEGHMVSSDAPHQPVMIRAVATAQTCGELAAGAAYDVTQLMGCALSCPVQLGDISGDVLLELPTLSDQCEAGVDACAMGNFNQ